MAWERQVMKVRRRLRHTTDKLFRADRDDLYYETIKTLIPELEFYKKEQVSHLLRRAEDKECKDLREYYELLKSDPEELSFLKKNLTFKGTHFFRGEDWEFFTEECLAKFEGRKRLRAWCAACSSGEEVYSLLMALMDYVPLKDLEVLATDYNDELLEKCRVGEYYNLHLSEIPERYQCYVELGTKKFRIREELRTVVHTKNLNLLTDPFPGPFDIILCRNVLKFFSRETIPQLHKKLAASLSEGGILFLSVDGDKKGIELIAQPEAMGLSEIDKSRGIYRRKETITQNNT